MKQHTSVAFVLMFILSMSPMVWAADCRFAQPRQLQGDLAGVQSVRVAVHANRLHLAAGAGPGFNLAGQVCASRSQALDHLRVTQQRSGDQLVLELGGPNQAVFDAVGQSHAYLDLTLQLPSGLPVFLDVGTGTADAAGMRQVQAQVGSGSLQVRDAGDLALRVGSGAAVADGLGRLDAGTVGSGSLTATRVRGDARIGAVASGRVRLQQVGGDVRVDALGSGTLEVSTVNGDFSLGTQGSGKVGFTGVKGKVSVPRR